MFRAGASTVAPTDAPVTFSRIDSSMRASSSTRNAERTRSQRRDDRAENTRQSWRSLRKTTLILRRSLSMQITIKYIFCTNGSRTDDRVAFPEISTFGRRTIKVNQQRKTVGLFFSDPSSFSRETPRRRRPIVSRWRDGSMAVATGKRRAATTPEKRYSGR